MTTTHFRFRSLSVSVLSFAFLLGACEVTVRVGRGHGGGGDASVQGDGGLPGSSDVGAPGTFDGPRIEGGAMDAVVGTPDGGPPPAHPAVTSATKVDLVFVVDDSYSMAPLQAKMRTRMPDFMDVLKALPGGLPDLHVAVVSSSLGAGIFGNVTGCTPGSAGNLDGNFQHKAGCGLNTGETFVKYKLGGGQNYAGDITDVVSCIADLGQNGCGFEHQLESLRLALQKAGIAGTENAGFLRQDAMLAVVFLTNEDDCSVDPNSMLFDPNQQSVADALGGLQSYRCTEFGHRCDVTLPHQAPARPLALMSCHSAEDGKLVRVREYINFLYGLKPGAPQNIFLGLIAGPTSPYVITSQSFMLGNGTTETQPTLSHSCTSGTAGTEYADPAVRLNDLAAAFAPNSFVSSICADDFRGTMQQLGAAMVQGN